MSLKLIILNIIANIISTTVGGIIVYYISKRIDDKTATKIALDVNKDDIKKNNHLFL
jgi:membrane protein DedA with SNARE-associated domain